MSESPQRPRMTRRQLREMEQARQQSAESQNSDAAPGAAQTGEEVSPPPAPVRPTMTRRQLREAAERKAAEQEAARREGLAQRAQDAPPPALETEGTSRDPEHPTRPRRSVLRADEEPRPGFFPAPRPETGSSAWKPEPQPAPVTDFAAGPVVKPPPGVSAIRTVEETGELSPVLHTAPGESQWPSIPGVDDDEAEMAATEARPLTPSGTPIPFRAPAWGARTSSAVEEAAEEPEPESISGMSAAPSIWPATGGLASGGTGVGAGSATSPSTGSGFPGAASGGLRTSTLSEHTDFEDDEDEEYEPMFTWLRLLVLMIIAFVLGALVWLIIGQGDANGTGVAAAPFLALICSKIPLGD